MEENLTPEQVIEAIETKFNEKMQSTATKSEVDLLKLEVETLKGYGEKSISTDLAIAKFEGKLEAMSERGFQVESTKSIGEQIVSKYSKDINSIKNGAGIELEVKADTTITGDYTGTRALTTLEPGVNRIVRQVRRLRDYMNMGTTASKFVTYIQQTLQSTAGSVLEAAEKPNGEMKFAEVSAEVKKIAGWIKVSKEMLEDLAFVRNEINNDLMESVEDILENALLNGAGTGSNLSGIYTTATAWVGTGFSATIVAPNLADVVLTAVAQIESNKFRASHVILHPRDIAKLSLSKTTQGEYTYGSFVQNVVTGTQLIAGLEIISTTWMTQGQFLVADMSKANVRMRETLNVQVGYVNDDFSRNMVTILAEMRLAAFVKLNDVNAFVKGTISTAITDLTKV